MLLENNGNYMVEHQQPVLVESTFKINLNESAFDDNRSPEKNFLSAKPSLFDP